MTYKTIYTEVDVDLSEFGDDALIDELEERGFVVEKDGIQDNVENTSKETLERIFHLRRQGREYQQELDLLIHNVLGRVL